MITFTDEEIESVCERAQIDAEPIADMVSAMLKNIRDSIPAEFDTVARRDEYIKLYRETFLDNLPKK